MSTIDATVSVMEELPEEARKQVLVIATCQLQAAKPSDPSATHSDEEWISILDHSDQQYHDGKARNMKSAIIEARRQHGYAGCSQ